LADNEGSILLSYFFELPSDEATGAGAAVQQITAVAMMTRGDLTFLACKDNANLLFFIAKGHTINRSRSTANNSSTDNDNRGPPFWQMMKEASSFLTFL